MIILSIVRGKNKTGQHCIHWHCSDGAVRTTGQVAEYVNMSKSTITKRLEVYGVHWLITFKGKIDSETHNKYKLCDHTQYHQQRDNGVPRSRNTGKILQQNGSVEDLLFPLPPEAPERQRANKAAKTTVINDDEATCAEAKRLLQEFNKKMIKKGSLSSSGTLVNPKFPSGYFGRHSQGIPCNIT